MQTETRSDDEIARTIGEFYEHVAAAITAAGGTVIKYIGDAALIVFPENAFDRGVEALTALKSSVDEFMAARGWECRLNVRIHFGTVVAGDFGGRYDVIGKAVNTAAMLKGSGVVLSPEARAKLTPPSSRA